MLLYTQILSKDLKKSVAYAAASLNLAMCTSILTAVPHIFQDYAEP